MSSARIALIGAPTQAGTNVPGCALGPAALRLAGLGPELVRLGHDVVDLGDLAPASDVVSPPRPFPTDAARNWREVAGWSLSLTDAVRRTLEDGRRPIVLGGDHSVSIGSVNGAACHAAAAGRPMFVLWLDAHTDFNTPATTPSGNLHGMSVAAFCGEPELAFVFGGGPRAVVPAANVMLFGIRSVDPGERALLKRYGAAVVDMRVIDEQGVAGPLEAFLDRVAAAAGCLHVSLDVDFLDPSLAPGVGTTVPGGATYREAHLVMEMLHDAGLVTSVDAVELNLFLDDRGRTARLMTDLLASLFGRQVFDRPTPAGMPF